MHNRDQREHTKIRMLVIFALLTMDMNPRQLLLFLNGYFKDCVCSFVVLLAQNPVLVIAIEIYSNLHSGEKHKKCCHTLQMSINKYYMSIKLFDAGWKDKNYAAKICTHSSSRYALYTNSKLLTNT